MEIKFENEEIWKYENGEIVDFLGVYSKTDGVYWAALFDLREKYENFRFYETSVQKLRAVVIRYFKNRELGIKDLPEYTAQYWRMSESAWDYVAKKFPGYSYWSKQAGELYDSLMRRVSPAEIKKRGYWMIGRNFVRREVYDVYSS